MPSALDLRRARHVTLHFPPRLVPISIANVSNSSIHLPIRQSLRLYNPGYREPINTLPYQRQDKSRESGFPGQTFVEITGRASGLVLRIEYAPAADGVVGED